MTDLTIDGSNLVVHMNKLDTVLAVRHTLTVPLTHITGVEEAQDVAAMSHEGFKEWGGYFPGVFRNGTFREEKKHVFWNVRGLKTARAIVITLADEFYVRLVLEVDDPAAAIHLIEEAREKK